MKRTLIASVALVAAAVAASAVAADKKPAAAATAAGAPAAAPATPAGPNMGQMHAGFTKSPNDVVDAKVPKAAGADARTVGEIFTKRTELKDKSVSVRGKVVKFTPGVMGKNWVHLRDGSGSAAEGTNDLVVTTADEASVGAIVLAKGTVRTDVQLGQGYAYPVLVEGANLKK